MNHSVHTRLLSLDVFRGIVMLLLIPDVSGGFSFYQMARRFPDNATWSFLARQFTHVQWSGAALWDLVMPSFIFMVGMALPYSYAARKQRGDSDLGIYTHAALRALTLLVLGIYFAVPIHTYLDFVWPLLLLSAGLPVGNLLGSTLGLPPGRARDTVGTCWTGLVLSVSIARLVSGWDHIGNPGLQNILPQIALAYLFAFPLVSRGRRVQASAVCIILAAYWLAFLLYPLPPPGFDPVTVGTLPGEEIFSGYFAHWNKNTNLAAAFDVWFLNTLVPSTHFAFNDHGYQTLNFVPSIATMILGMMTGEYLRKSRAAPSVRNRLLVAGCLAWLAGIVAGATLCPIVKSIWTPSWVLFSAGFALVAVAALYHFMDLRQRPRWTVFFTVVGLNPILLYTLAVEYRWWIVEAWRRTFSASLFTHFAGPVLESLACLLSLWAFAFVLYRLRIFIRL